jgi:hypothetical protein
MGTNIHSGLHFNNLLQNHRKTFAAIYVPEQDLEYLESQDKGRINNSQCASDFLDHKQNLDCQVIKP